MLIDKYELFVYTVEDLQKRIRVKNYYNALRACGLCRQLLLDEYPLIFAIGKDYHRNIRFHVAQIPEHDLLLNIKLTPFPLAWVTILPNRKVFKKSTNVGIKDFLEIPLLKLNNHIYEVKDVIKAGSNIMGGIHLGIAKNQKEGAFLALDKAAKSDQKLTFFALTAINKVVLKALKPVAKMVKSEQTLKGGFKIRYSAVKKNRITGP